MRHFLRLSDIDEAVTSEIFAITDKLIAGGYKNFLRDKTVVMFFPASSLRTRITFEKGVHLLGGQTVLFPPETLDKKEELRDMVGYLNNWADVVVARHRSIELLDKMSAYASFPVVNAMTDLNHPCEILSDLYALSRLRDDYLCSEYLFCGAKGNIGYAWREAALSFGLSLTQCCPEGYEMDGVPVIRDLRQAVIGKGIICTDSYPEGRLDAFRDYQVTREVMEMANPGALLNPCPPFFRGEEVSSEVIDSPYFVGYAFKKHLLEIQQAVIIYCLTH